MTDLMGAPLSAWGNQGAPNRAEARGFVSLG
eukprot:CAMPEP_0174301374 /NCGR_PEP_ID=MMETSP0809-20121228/59012_1 /TAXON_ID=73025 ORGANISM="Eutreptiella gymnastica-like, Strain CCMP1594" /NCGR_SAMPLE_ID=MMETSP0809 /ASSEMBLY_ACC=CAM_ASM_000658 /LENGTH=30 /DNA_ID= /DNA_START= /DNA_END= /DNA_ORIENTATION=